jgi:hypothetical protein
VVGYVAKFKDAPQCFRVGLPDYSQLSQKVDNWEGSVYGNDHEEFLHNMPAPLGKLVHITEYVDANLFFDLVTGQACTGILIFLNQTLIDWYYKKQSTVAYATFSYKFVAAKSAMEKAYDLRYTLRMMGIPLDYQIYVFGDNLAVIIQSIIPHSQLEKRHNVLAYHYTHEAIATGMIHMYHVDSIDNPADCMTKFLGYLEWIRILCPVLFWQGDTATFPTKGE